MNKRFMFLLLPLLTVAPAPKMHGMETSSNNSKLYAITIPAIALMGWLYKTATLQKYAEIENENTRQFIINEIKKVGIENPEKISLKTSNNVFFAAYNFINIPSGDLTCMQNILENGFNIYAPTNNKLLGLQHQKLITFLQKYANKKNTFSYQKGVVNQPQHGEYKQLMNKQLNFYKYVIQHEANHVKNNDARNTVILGTAIGTLFAAIDSNNLLFNTAYILGTALLGIQYKRSCEQRADDQTEDNVENLEAAIEHFQHYACDDLLHPPLATRIEKCKQRIAAIKAKKYAVSPELERKMALEIYDHA